MRTKIGWVEGSHSAGRGWAAGLFVAALVLVAGWLLGGPGTRSLASTTTVSVTQESLGLTVSPNPHAGSPVTITESGEVGVTSTLTVFVQPGPCSLDDAEEIAAGDPEIDQRVISATSTPFSVTSAFTPAAAGTYYICGYLDGASGGTEEDQSSSAVFVVAPAPPSSPPAAAAPPTPTAAAGPSTGPCVVPGLARHSLAGAKRLLESAGCSLGVVLEPSARGLRRTRSRPGGKSLVLVVGSQFPAAGTRLRANQYVAVRLVLGKPPRGPKPAAGSGGSGRT
jgi:hypothetical protein